MPMPRCGTKEWKLNVHEFNPLHSLISYLFIEHVVYASGIGLSAKDINGEQKDSPVRAYSVAGEWTLIKSLCK